MNIKVLKFGGTSMKTSGSRKLAAQKIINLRQNGYSVAVVVSAMGRKDDPYSTDALMNVANASITAHDRDLLLSCGELISAAVFSSELCSYGIPSQALSGANAGIITDDNYTSAKILKVNPQNITNCLAEGKTAVIAGFQGISTSGEVTTLGRGASDLSAVIVAGALGCREVDIYTDVDGIMTADPNIVSNAGVLSQIDYYDVFELASNGAKVIHPGAVEAAMHYNLNIRIKNTFSEHDGTIICSGVTSEASVASLGNRAAVFLPPAEYTNSSQVLKEIYESGISIDVINISPAGVNFTVTSSDLAELKNTFCKRECKIIEDVCKVSLVSSKMKGVPGVMYKVVNALANAGVDILMSADSHSTISVIVHEKDSQNAVKAIHNAEYPF